MNAKYINELSRLLTQTQACLLLMLGSVESGDMDSAHFYHRAYLLKLGQINRMRIKSPDLSFSDVQVDSTGILIFTPENE
jgi:hypothetical protein